MNVSLTSAQLSIGFGVPKVNGNVKSADPAGRSWVSPGGVAEVNGQVTVAVLYSVLFAGPGSVHEQL